MVHHDPGTPSKGQGVNATGGQGTVASAVNFPALALNSNYAAAESVDTLEDFLGFLEKNRETKGPVMCHVRVRPGTVDGLGRPGESGPELRDKFMAHLRRHGK